jgi:hypothetical protein
VTTTYSITAISGATTYNWTVPTGWTILNGQGSTSISVLVGANSGTVSVTPMNACGIGSRCSKNVTVSGRCYRNAEVTDTEVPDAILYPNPASESFTIESGDALASFVEVMDLSGKIVFNGTGVRQVTTAELPEGIYLVRIFFKNEIQVKRIEIMH